MEFIKIIEQLFADYGYWVLLVGLPLDAIALPIPPGNTTLAYSGYLSYKGILDWRAAVIAAYLGSVTGMSATYWIGYKIGMPLIDRYGKWLLLKPAYLERTRKFYAKYGTKALLLSYFMPGVRQFIGYFAGMIRVPFKTFALYAYTGSLLWVLAFIGIGNVFGEEWQVIFGWVQDFLLYIFIAFIAAAAFIVFIRWRKLSKARARNRAH